MKYIPLSARVLLPSCLLVAGLCSTSLAQQYHLQHATSIDLSQQFFGPNPPDGTGTAASAYGWNPLSIAFDGTNAYVGGYNNGSLTAPNNTVGVVRVDNALTLGSTFTPLASTLFTANTFRGINDLAYDLVSGDIYGAYDSGAANTSTVTRWKTDGTQVWKITEPFAGNPTGQRPFALAIDPVADAGAPAVAVLNQGSGRRMALKTADGSALYTATGGTAPGGIVNNPTGNVWRAMAFDDVGNIILGEDNGVFYGVRVNANQWQNLAGTLNLSSASVIESVAVNNVGKGVALLQGVGSSNLLAFSPRGGAFSNTLTDLTGGTMTVDTRRVQIRNLNGSPTGLTQTELLGSEDGIGAAWTDELRNMAFGRDAIGNPVLAIVSFVERRLDTYTLEPTWIAPGAGSWTTAVNWLANAIPNSGATNAVFGGAITSAATVTLDGPKTVRNIRFDNANRYTIAGTDTLTFDSAGTTRIGVLSGSHTISAPIQILKDMTIDVPSATGSLLLTNDLGAASVSVSKTGAGLVHVRHIRGASQLDIQEGTVEVLPRNTPNDPAATSVVGSLTIAGGPAAPTATLHLQANSMVVDYTDTSPIEDVRQLLAAGAATGKGIVGSTTTSGAKHGYGESLQVLGVGGGTFAGQSVDDTAVLIKYTYAGDSNLDGQVDITDLGNLATNWQTNGAWTAGDSDYSGFIDITDLGALATNWQAGVGNPLGPTFGEALASVGLPGVSVPEPATWTAAITILIALRARIAPRTRRPRRT